MRSLTASVTASLILGVAPFHAPLSVSPRADEPIVNNDNTRSAGTLANGVLTLRLEVRAGDWRPDGDDKPGVTVYAFAEEGKPLQVPGPLIRVAEGTEIHAFVRNTLNDSTLHIYGLNTRGAVRDSLEVAPGAVREVTFTAGAAGTYHYWARTQGTNGIGRRGVMDGELSGAFIVDPRGTVTPPRERVLVIGLWERRNAGGVIGRNDPVRFWINGRAWPNTERLSYSVGDTVRFRLVNLSAAVHPMHLHGFYFNVDSRGNGTQDTIYDPKGSRHLVVTERLAPGRTYTMTWVPERPGNWMFHCHDNVHVLRNKPFDGTLLPAEHLVHTEHHAADMMGGLVMGIQVRDKGVALAAKEPPARRRLRLVARVDTTARGTIEEPAYGYVLEERGRALSSVGRLIPGPTILLRRGEPVSITVVNELPDATSVHWHGIELDSYYDGVADFSGHPGRISPAIAPRDSFEARFTPPRSGTFMYHPHADELRQQEAGLSGSIVVLDAPDKFDRTHDLVWLLTTPRTNDEQGQSIYINGTSTPQPLELRAGERYRIRLINIHTFRPSIIVRMLRDTVPESWRPIAKDGMDLPADQATSRPSVQQIGNGEAYDYELIPTAGDLTVTVRAAAGQLLLTMPVKVR